MTFVVVVTFASRLSSELTVRLASKCLYCYHHALHSSLELTVRLALKCLDRYPRASYSSSELTVCLVLKCLDRYPRASHSHPTTCQNKAWVFFNWFAFFFKVWQLLFLKWKRSNGRIKIKKMTDTQTCIEDAYYRKIMKIENNWKKWKGHAAIKFKKLENIFKI